MITNEIIIMFALHMQYLKTLNVVESRVLAIITSLLYDNFVCSSAGCHRRSRSHRRRHHQNHLLRNHRMPNTERQQPLVKRAVHFRIYTHAHMRVWVVATTSCIHFKDLPS